MHTTPAGYNNLDPLTRADFDSTLVRQWRITWPDGASEMISGHTLQYSDSVAKFHWNYLGAHRIVNLTHVRDIAELSADPDGED